jgi:DNA-binding beta-propeller fold protein YncE
MAEDHEHGWEKIAVSWRSFLIWATASLVAVPAMSRAGTAQPGGAPLQRVQTIPLTGPSGRLDHMALDTVRHRLFVANTPNDSLDVLDLTQGKLLKQVPGQRGIQGIAYAADLDLIFVGNGSGSFNVFDGRDYHLLKSLHPGDDCDNVRYDPRAQRAYVIHAPQSLAGVNAKTQEVVHEIPLPGDPESFQLERDRPRIYLNTPSPSQVVVVDTEKQSVQKVYPLTRGGANFPMALDEADHRLLVGCRRPPLLDVLDTETGKEVTSVAIPGDTDDVWYDAVQRRVYVSCGEGYVAVISQTDPDHYAAIAQLPTQRGARTSLYDPASHSLYLLVPRQSGSPAPEVWVFQTHS